MRTTPVHRTRILPSVDLRHVDTPSKFPGVYECAVQCSVQSMYTRLHCTILCTRPAAAVKARTDRTSYFSVVRMSLF